MGASHVPFGTTAEHPCDSVGAESVPHKSNSCPIYLQRLAAAEDCWLRTKSGVTALTRCQRQLDELMAMLAKVCTSGVPRRRTHEPFTAAPDKNTVTLATHLLSAYKVAFGWQPKQDVVPAIYMPYLTGWITRLIGIMFDERRMPYHVLLYAFYHSGCHSAYFSIIRRCISLEMHQKQSIEMEQLLQTWLSLTERLVNADAFVHSRHRLPQHCVEAKHFPAQKYLSLCQQDALREVSSIFGLLVVSMKAGNASMSVCELTVSLYKEILKGLIPSTDAATKCAVSAEDRNKLIAELDEASINFLVDMGFDRDTVIEALFEYATVEEATDFLVANDRQQHASANDILIDELEDGESAEMSEERKDADGEEVEKGTEEETPPPLSEVTSLDVNAILETTCSEVVPACMQMIELGVELVFNTSELLLAIVNDVNAEWRCDVLVKQYLVNDILAMLRNLTTDPSNEAIVHTLSTRLHLSCLLWAAIANDYLSECAQSSLQCVLLSTLELTASTLQCSHALVNTVKCNRAKLEKVVESLSWKYWDADERGGTFMWVNYRPASSHILTRAFMEGRAGAKLSIAGKHYAVSFITMCQRNVDSHVERPITVVARLKEDANIELFFKADDAVVEWNEVVRARMVPAVIALMGSSGLDSNAVHALLILAARITRSAEVASEMLRQGGVQAVVNVAGCPFATRALLVALVVRHCLDDETSLCQIFEKTIRTVAAGGYTLNPPSTRWHHRMPRTTREWLHAMRALAPLCARHPRLFVSTMEHVARKQNGQITTVPMPPSEGGPKLPPPSAPVRQVVQQLMDHVMDFSWEDSSRVVTRATLIRLIAELVKSYSAVAMLVAESQHASTHSALLTLLDKCTVAVPDTECSDSTASAIELLTAVKSLVIALASCNHSPKAQEALVADIGTAFRIALTETDSKVATMKIKTLCDLILLARDMCPAGGHEARATGSLHANLNPILRLLIKKRICIELAKVPWHLNLSTKEGIDALNHVLKTLDELTRSINSSAGGAQAEGVAGTRASSQNASATLTLTTTTNATDAVNPTPARTENALNDDAVGESAGAEQQHEHHPIVRRMLEEFNEHNEEPQPETEEDSTETDEEEEENADEEMEFEDDEGAANEIDIEDESDEEEEERDDEAMREEEERDDEAMREEGQDSDEEDDFGLIDMGDENVGRRFEDGDPDNTLIDANVFLESLDDIDRLGGYEVSRADRSSVSEVAVHPLMQRPTLNADSAALRNTGYRLTISGRRPATVTAPGLHRQGAVRRWGTVGPQRDILERLIESGTVANAAHLFDVLPSRQRLFNIILHESASEAINTALGEERRHAAVPSPLERFTEAAHLIDAHSHFYVWLVVAHHITAYLDDLEKKEKEEKEKLESKKKELEKENIDETKEAEGNTTNEMHVGSAAEAQPSEQPDVVGEAGLDSVEPAPSESAFVAESTGNGDDRVFQALPPSVSAEPMDTTDSGTVFFDAHENLEGDSSERQEEMMTAVTVRSPTPEESNEMLVSTPPLSPRQEAERGTEAASVSNAAEEYRDILGDIEVPEGVDPAFLAALPEDIRAEVIRDHERQQRAQRLAQSAASGAAEGAPGDEAAAAGGSSAPGVEPLDQEFLNALPPELQEEILAQHERTVRLANERAENAASSSGTGGEPPPSTEGDDAAALIESLPPSLRAQVLADADDTVLQVLPQSVAAEARRLRANLEQQQVMRFARMLAPGRFQRMIGSRGSTLTSNSAQLGALAGATTLASKNATQLLDRDALVTLIMLFFVDPARFSAQRLQKVLRSVCVQSATCDFVVWCLVAVLDKVTSDSSRYEEFAGSSTGWIDHICVPSALGQHERAIKFFKNYHSVVVHPAVAASATRLVLEMLTSLARAYPGHFVPAKLRSADSTASTSTHSHPLSQFWHIVHGLSKGETQQLRSSGHRHSTSSISMECSSVQGGVSASLASATLEESAVGLLMAYLNRPVVSSSSQLQDKLLRLVCTIVQTLPDDTMAKLSTDEKLERPPLAEQLGIIVTVLTEGKCSEEGLADGRTLLMEAIRALAPSTRTFLHSLFISAAERLGQRLLPLMAQLQNELSQLPIRREDSILTLAPITSEQSSSRRTTINRYDESTVVIDGVSNSRQVMNSSGCEELQLPAVRALTDKHGVQNTLLRTLHTIIKMKDALDASTIRKREIQKNEQDGATSSKVEEERLSVLLSSLEPLWGLVSACLHRLAKADAHAALALQPAAEAFFLVHGSALAGVDPNKPIEHPDAIKLVQFAEKHRTVLNQVLRQSGSGLSDGPFSILIQMPKLLDFDVKRKYFRKQMQRLDGPVRGEDVAVRIRRSHLFSDSFRELFRLRGPEWKARFYIIFEGEEGQDAGGLLREWFSIITREIFNPNYALFITAPGDRVTYMINKASYINPEHLEYFKFVGRIIAKAIYENKLLDCYFTRAFYKHILSVPVRAQDLESEDPSFYKSLEFLLNNPIEDLGTELTFSVEVEEFGVRKMRELKEGGASIPVTDDNKEEYVKLVCQMKMTGSINQQLSAFLDGFYEVIPKQLIAMFNEQELELLISGLPNIDIDDLYANTEYKTYSKTSAQIQWFWKALRSFEQEDRAKFLQFVTGTSKVPLQGFASLEGMNGVQKFSIHMDSRSCDRLPAAHTCFNQLDLPQYESYEKLRDMLLLAVRECTEGFGFA
uniref:HECT-type E3 ubiquitin transferase n=2 Tax=Ascaris suum TaxID=6253 RepID=F1KPI8_ASCSU